MQDCCSEHCELGINNMGRNRAEIKRIQNNNDNSYFYYYYNTIIVINSS